MSNFQLTDDQQNASVAFTDFLLNKDEKYMIIQGSAGTGKSTLVKHLLKTMEPRMKLYSLLLGNTEQHKKFSIELTATTNKAAVVLGELTDLPTRTVHSKIGLTMRENYKTGEVEFIKGKQYEVMYNTLLVIDEASFISKQLYRDIDESTVNCKILLVGDQYQLAPIRQAESVMENLPCKKANLEQIMRHGGPIAEQGAVFREAVKTGVFTDITPNGEDIIHVDGPTFQKMIDQAFLDPDYDTDKARVLAWTNTKVQQYNDHIRSILGLSEDLGEEDELITNKPILGTRGMLFNTDARVKITDVCRNETIYGIEGRMVELNYGPELFLPNNQYEVTAFMKRLAKVKEWHQYFEIKNTWLDLRPVFASTVHKAQGSTYETVFINLSDIGRCHIASDVARMLYVAITRASKKVVLYGSLPEKYRGT